MLCPKCGTEIPEGLLYCEKCGEEIQIVPDYDPLLDVKLGQERNLPGQKPLTKDGVTAKKKSKVTKGQIVAWSILALLSITVFALIIITQRDVKRNDSLEYQTEQADRYFYSGEYDKAIKFYSRAIELDSDNVELLEKLANVYFLQNNDAWHEAIVRKIMSHPNATEEQIRNAEEKLITILVKRGNFEEIRDLVTNSNDVKLQSAYQKYLCPKPLFLLPEGTYSEIQSLQIVPVSGWKGKIYYTLDGSVPGENGILYSLPIILEKGKTVVRACFINEYGVKSETVSNTYVIEEDASE